MLFPLAQGRFPLPVITSAWQKQQGEAWRIYFCLALMWWAAEAIGKGLAPCNMFIPACSAVIQSNLLPSSRSLCILRVFLIALCTVSELQTASEPPRDNLSQQYCGCWWNPFLQLQHPFVFYFRAKSSRRLGSPWPHVHVFPPRQPALARPEGRFKLQLLPFETLLSAQKQWGKHSQNPARNRNTILSFVSLKSNDKALA